MKNTYFVLLVIVLAQVAFIAAAQEKAFLQAQNPTETALIQQKVYNGYNLFDNVYNLSTPKKISAQPTNKSNAKDRSLPTEIKNLRVLKFHYKNAVTAKDTDTVKALKKQMFKLGKRILRACKKIIKSSKKYAKELIKENKTQEATRVEMHIGHLQRIVNRFEGKKWTKTDKVEEIKYRIEKMKILINRKGLQVKEKDRLQKRLASLEMKLKKIQSSK